MRTRILCGSSTTLALVMVLTLPLPALGSAVEAGVGGNCNAVRQQITRDWFELKRFFRPDDRSLKRPKSSDFFCVSPSYVREIGRASCRERV